MSKNLPSPMIVQSVSARVWLAILAAQLLVTITVLQSFGQTWWCKFNDRSPWISSASSEHTSQHLFDPYSFTHIAHGFFFFSLFACVAPGINMASRFLMAVGLECVWEVAENTPFVINRYRTATAALGYEGDSIANSLADIVSCGGGFLFALLFGWRITLLTFAVFEAALLVTIRDSLLLNVIMLCYPIDAIRQWQLGTAG
jgi:hypothetical protein